MPSDREIWYRAEIRDGEVLISTGLRDGSIASFESWGFRRTKQEALDVLASSLDTRAASLQAKADMYRSEARTVREVRDAD